MDEARAESFEGHLKRTTEAASSLESKLADTKAALAQAESEVRQLREDDEGMEVHYSGCYLDEEDETEWWPEAILGRRVVKKQLWYRVKWRGHNLVTWEKDDAIENRLAVEQYEHRFREKSEMPPTSSRRFASPCYVPNSRRRRAARGSGDAGGSNDVTNVGSDEGMHDGTAVVVWSCEVEPNIWIPYDEVTSRTIEQAHRARAATVAVLIPRYGTAVIDFQRCTQTMGATRRVQRTVRRSDDEERRVLESMSIDELRRYIAGIIEFTPAHFEALSRLSEADRVPVHASKADLESAVVQLTFAQVMDRICEGFDFPGLTTECYICLEDYDGDSVVGVLQTCGHVFHHKCIAEYLGKYSKLCPVCKQPMCV